MKNDAFDKLLREAAADCEADTPEYMAELDLSGESVSPELDMRMKAMFKARRRDRLMRAVASGIAAAVAVFCVVLSLRSMMPEVYLIGDAADPSWFPAEVEKTVLLDTESEYKAKFVTENGKVFRLVQQKLEDPTSENDAPTTEDQEYRSERFVYNSGGITIYECDEMEYDSTGAEFVCEWSDGEYRYILTGTVDVRTLEKIARSAGAE